MDVFGVCMCVCVAARGLVRAGPVPDGVEFNVSLVDSLLRAPLPANVSYLMGTNLDEVC